MRTLGLINTERKLSLRFIYITIVLGCVVFWLTLINVLLMILE
jgi:hypothetical protein